MKRGMKRIKGWVALGLLLVGLGASNVAAQQYTGMTGLIHVPTAEMNREGDARLGAHFINKELLPLQGFIYKGERYHTFSHYVSITPFRWMEIGYTCTLFRWRETKGDFGGYGAKDRYFSLKLNPLREGKWWPAVAVGCNDVLDSRSFSKHKTGELFFANYYVAASKHFDWKGTELGGHVVYRRFIRNYNDRWTGVVGGLTVRPRFAPILRGVVEYDGNGVNVGADCLLWRHLLVQVAMQRGRYFSGGLCYQLNLF